MVVWPHLGLDQAHLWWVSFYDRLDMAHDGILQSWVDLVGFWACSPLVLGLDLLGCGLPSLGLCRMVFLLCSLAHL